MVQLILFVVGLLFVLISVLLVVVGTLAIIGQIDGGIAGGVATIVIALLPLYVAYLLGRSAWRIRLSLATVQGRARQRATLRTVLASAAILVASNVFAPVPTGEKIVGTILTLVIVPVVLAAELEPRK